TLDPTTRRLSFDGGTGSLLTDTVGFISNLPHSLVNAFKSTLEETARADLQLLVLDASDGNICEQYQTVLQVLKEIDALNAPRIIVLNKIDSVKDMFTLRRLENNFPQAVRVSALEKTGFDELISAIRQMLFGAQKTYELPLEKAEILELIRKTGILISSEWQENAIKIEAQVSGKAQSLLAPYEILYD
ncbi:MAG: 50S ribosome-binding GTPase, partial [Spirochaetaceae bacterium]|nr:50S ribosome-binding GTPase [Spirochaetaceae bacterium]